MSNLNFGTFASANGAYLTFRVLGFGVMVYNMEAPTGPVIDKTVWGVPILPNWRFAFVAPWL